MNYRQTHGSRRVSIIEGKMTLTHFDGSARSSVKKWVKELDTYFWLNPMREGDAIRHATLHLDGDAME